MKKLLLTVSLAFAAGTAFAHNCPNEMKAIDAKLATPVQLYWTYITAWAAEEGVVQFRDDIYNLDGLDVYVAQQTGVPL